MRTEGFFEWLGNALGSIIRLVVDSLAGLFDLVARAGHDFLQGLSRALGMDTSLVSLAVLAIGILLLVAAARALFQRAFVNGAILLLLALWLLSWLIH